VIKGEKAAPTPTQVQGSDSKQIEEDEEVGELEEDDEDEKFWQTT